MRISMIGARGVPATFGGIEHHVEELGSRLAAGGHEVVVYCRKNYVADPVPTYRGMTLIHLPTVGTKHLDSIVHSALSTVDAMRRRSDIVHFHALGPGLVAPLPRLVGSAKVVLTVHGRDDLRAKWGPAAKAVLGAAQWMSGHVPDATVFVSRSLMDSDTSPSSHRTVYIPNGVSPAVPREPGVTLGRFGLEPRRYLLWVGRLVPEKAPDLLIRAFRQIDDAGLKLAVVGGSSFTDDFVRTVGDLARSDPRVILTGYQYGDALAELYTNAAAFTLPSNLEGLPLTLLEAASYGLPIVASDIPPHLEILGSAPGPGRRIFPAGDEAMLAKALAESLASPNEREDALRLRDDVLQRYSWQDGAEATNRLYVELLNRGDPTTGR